MAGEIVNLSRDIASWKARWRIERGSLTNLPRNVRGDVLTTDRPSQSHPDGVGGWPAIRKPGSEISWLPRPTKPPKTESCENRLSRAEVPRKPNTLQGLAQMLGDSIHPQRRTPPLNDSRWHPLLYTNALETVGSCKNSMDHREPRSLPVSKAIKAIVLCSKRRFHDVPTAGDPARQQHYYPHFDHRSHSVSG